MQLRALSITVGLALSLSPMTVHAEDTPTIPEMVIGEPVDEPVQVIAPLGAGSPPGTASPAKLVHDDRDNNIYMQLPMLVQEEHLTKDRGFVTGPSGTETYYNLPMDGIIDRMRRKGFLEENGWIVWTREDGAKMIGDFVICAANLDVHPRYSLVETTLGTAIVCDTGAFAKTHPNHIDIACNW